MVERSSSAGAAQDAVADMAAVGLGIEDRCTSIAAIAPVVARTYVHGDHGFVKKLPRPENSTEECGIRAVGMVVAACGQLP